MRILIISFFSFIVLVSYQNCAQVSENQPSDDYANNAIKGPPDNSTNPPGTVTCQAIATNDIEIGFLFESSAALPQKYEVELNGNIVYSSCQNASENKFFSNGRALPVSAAPDAFSRFHIYRSYDHQEDLFTSIDSLKLYGMSSCGSAKNVLFNLEQAETINYETYQLCETEGLRAKIDYVINQN